MDARIYTAEDIALMVEVLKASPTVTVACLRISEALNRFVDPDKISEILKRRGLNTAGSYVAKATSKPSFVSGQASGDDMGASSFYTLEVGRGADLPEGHRIKGVSVLSDGAGKVDRRWDKTERDSADPPAFDIVPPGHLIKKVSSLLDGQGKVRAQWIQAPQQEVEKWDAFWKACEENSLTYKGLTEPVAPPLIVDADTITIVPLGDPHLGMLSWHEETGNSFDLKIVQEDLLNVVRLLVDRSPSSHHAILANVGDFYHSDDDNQLTPQSGHKLDVDSRAAKVFQVGCWLMRSLIDLMLRKHQIVDVRNVPGNHDPKTSRMLAMWLSAVYENEPRVIITPNLNPFSYRQFGKNLFGFVHGDGVKPSDLPSIMAYDEPQAWGLTEHRLWVTGHVHHESCKEYIGATVETFRTLAARDYWHHSKGYRSGRSLSSITFHKDFGEITRSTVDLGLGRRAA